MIAYKLFRQRRDGSLGPLFINRSQVVPMGVWLTAEEHPTPGYAYRPGWHATLRPEAPHLSTKGRVWAKVELHGTTTYDRPESQGGTWILAACMRVLEVLDFPSDS